MKVSKGIYILLALILGGIAVTKHKLDEAGVEFKELNQHEVTK